MAADVSRIQGSVEIQGLDQAVTGLNTLSTSFDKAGTSSTAALRQINQFGTLGQNTQTAATGVNALATANQQYTQSARARISVDDQLEKVQLRLRLAQTDASGRVAILRQQYEQLAAAARPLVLSQDEITKRTIAATQAAVQLANAERAVAREQQSQLATAASGVGRGVLQGIGAGGILGGLGLAGGIAIATRSIIDLGTETADLAIKAQTIGTAYEAATKRAGFAADDLLKKLDTAARGTASDTDLMAASNKALALGVGQNAQQIADLLAIARQKGKDFGESTTQAFEDITVGLGRLSPRILDNLGIILDENKIYKAYADAIGVAEGKLSDQEKRQALVNELIRTNTDLITKNASANLDAADKIAAANAREQASLERLGKASLPIRVGAENAAASFFEAVTGKPYNEALARSQELARVATNYEDYVKRINAARSQLTPGFHFGDPNALIQITPDQFNAIQIDKQADAHLRNAAAATANADALKKAGAASAESGQAAALTKEDYDRLGTSLQVATEQGLKPFKAAVDAAKTSLDAQKASTAAAKDTVDSISGALDKAKNTYKEFASARLVEDQKYQKQLFDLDQQSAVAERKLLEFKAPGAGLDQLTKPIQEQIDAAAASTDDWKQKLDAANDAVDRQSGVLNDAEAAQKSYDDAVGAAKDNLDAQQSRLSALQDVYDKLGQSIDDARHKMDDLRNTPLQGEGAVDDTAFWTEQTIKQQQLKLELRKRAFDEAPTKDKDELKRRKAELDQIQGDIDNLRREADIARLRADIKYDPQHRLIDQQNNPHPEKTVEEVTASIAEQQAAIDKNMAAQQTAGQAVKDQQKVVSDAKFDLMDATAAQQDHTKAVDAEKAALDKLKATQSDISKQYQDQKTLLADLKQQLDTTTKDALKPFQDQIDEVARQASLAKIAEKLEIDPLKKKIEETTASTKLLTFQEIIDGIKNTNDVIAILEPRLTAAQNVLKKEQDATKVLQDVYDGTTKALAAQQTYFDNLKQGLDALKANLQGSKDIWGDLSTLIGAINSANGIGNTGGIPGQQAPFTPGASGAGPGYNAQAIDSVLAKAGSPLTGQGQFIIEMSQKYGIPVEIALAMWKVEGNYGTAGASVANKNPGNLRGSNFAAGTNGGFAMFDSWKAGIEGFFDLLRHNTHGYDTDVDKYKQGDVSALLDLIKTYAPTNDNNDPQAYYQSVVGMIQQLLKIISNGGGGDRGMAGTINNGTMADDPRPSQYGIDSVVAGGHLGDTFDADRGALGVHAGLDLQITNGSPVHAPLDLTDIRVGYYADAARKGYFVTGIDQYGREWYFGHMTAVFVKNGGSIAKGSTIGTVGMGHVHVQLKQNPGGPPIDPSAALDSAAASGAGPGVVAPDPYLAQSTTANDLFPVPGNPDVYPGQSASIAGPHVGQPITMTGGFSFGGPHLGDPIVMPPTGMLDTGGGGMSVGGPHFGDPIVTPPDSMKDNDPTWGDLITATAGAATDATASVEDASGKWQTAWTDMGDATVAAMKYAKDQTKIDSDNIVDYVATAIQRIEDLIAKILSIPGIHVHTGPDQHDPSDPANPGGPSAPPATPGPTSYNNITINTRDSDRAMRLMRQRGYAL